MAVARPARPWRMAVCFAAWSCALAMLCSSAHAEGSRYCGAIPTLTAQQVDRVLQFAALVQAELDRSGQRVALVARSGLDLERFGQRYSHAGVSLRDSRQAPWAVRQLYYACDERRSRLFDQGLAGFLLGSSDADGGHLSVLLLPAAPAAALQRAALDDRQALGLLQGSYSANAHAHSLLHQNCNQWLVELLALAWRAPASGGLAAGAQAESPSAPPPSAAPASAPPASAIAPSAQPQRSPRAQAQAWLQAQGYRPSVIHVINPWVMLAGALSPFVHHDDQPPEDMAQWRYQVSLPASIEAFVRERWPQTQRIEFCRAGDRVVVRHDGAALPADCQAGPGDQVLALQ